MPKSIRSYNTTITISSADKSGSVYTDHVDITGDEFRPISDAGGYIEQVVVKGPSEKVIFSFKITNDNDHVVYRRRNVTGEIADPTHVPVKGDLVLTVETDVDDSYAGDYEVELMFREET